MAGFLVKILIEDTHPPVWRRMLIPEKIHFSDLHEIIQIAFEWMNTYWHDFAFPKKSLRIFSDGDEWGIGRNEKDALVDEYIETCTFIRYSFENEREGSLKIILEKADSEYCERFARIVKTKGDDCAIEEVNAQLKRLELPERESVVREEAEEDFGRLLDAFLMKGLKKNGLNPKAVFELLSAAENLKNGKTKQDVVQKETSAIGTMAAEWQNLVDDLTQGTALSHPADNVKLTKKTSDKTSLDMLRKLTAREALDYCKYLDLHVSTSDSKEEQIVKIADFLRENPVKYLWQMEEEEVDSFLEICRQEDGPIVNNFCTKLFYYAIGVGMVEIYVHRTGVNQDVEISVAKDAVSLLKNITKTKWKTEVQRLDRARTDMSPILQMYGMLDLHTLYKMCKACVGIKWEETEFYRFLYWHLRMRGEVQTANCAADNKPYVALKEVDMARAMWLQMTKGTFLLYKYCTKEDWKRWSKGFCRVYDCWQFYADFLYHGCKIPMEVCRRHLGTAFHAVRNGAKIHEFMKLLQEIYTPRSAYEYKEVWELQMSVLMETAVYGLKGCSRQEYRECLGKLPEELSLAEENGLSEEQIKENSHIYQMSRSIQEQLYFVMDQEYREGEKILEKLLARTGEKNREMILYVVSHYACNGKFKKAYELVRRAQKTCGDADGSLKGTLKMLDDMADTADDFEKGFTNNSLFTQVLAKHPQIIQERDDKIIRFPQETGKTYRRETKKIGRNDPCPCGSGKKYKHCCGKK